MEPILFIGGVMDGNMLAVYDKTINIPIRDPIAIEDENPNLSHEIKEHRYKRKSICIVDGCISAHYDVMVYEELSSIDVIKKVLEAYKTITEIKIERKDQDEIH